MIKWECIEKYQELFSNDQCAYSEPDTLARVLIADGKGHSCIQPKDETDEIFLERLERSKAAGRNLFFEEWEKFKYDPDCVY